MAVRCRHHSPVHHRAWLRQPGASLVLCAFAWSGCLGVFANDGSSVSLGSHAKGALLHGVAMPFEGVGYEVHPGWRGRNHRYATAEVARWLTQVFQKVDAAIPGATAHLGDMSARGGGDAAMHRSHVSGRDIDIFYFASDGADRPLQGLPAMLHFDRDGRAARWSTPGAGQTIRVPLPEAHFDTRRNWVLVREMLSNSVVEVQWIFMCGPLTVLLIEEAEREGAPAELVDRAREILHQPTDSQPHDDHMHVRVFCDPADRTFGCNDKGPKRWLKKHWKYMRAGGSL